MNTCKTCSHWHKGVRWWYGQCDLFEKVKSQESLDGDGISRQFGVGLPWSLRDESDAYAKIQARLELLTGPDFGCVHHTAARTLGD